MAVRTIDVRERIMARNDELAEQVRERLNASHVPALNLVSSPGAGKTLLLERTLADLGRELVLSVITGDVQTQNDADRLARHTDRLVQAVITAGACHLDARQILTALDAIDLGATDLLFIENVGNLVCPSSYDLGEEAKIVLLSVTEGEEKPLKYPSIFFKSKLILITKIDLLPFVPFDLTEACANARSVNADADLLQISCQTGEGLADWIGWLGARVKGKAVAGR